MRTFTIVEKPEGYCEIYLGNPEVMGCEAELVATLDSSYFPSLIADLKNYLLNR